MDTQTRIDAYTEALAPLTSLWQDAIALAGQASSLRDLEHQSVTLATDLEAIDTVLTRVTTDISRGATRIKAASLRPDIDESELDQLSRDEVRKRTRWIDYAEARIGAAFITYEAVN